jgi:hypothetical protein
MDPRTLQEVQSEVIALESVLIAVFRRLAKADMRTTRLLCDSFDEAETVMSGLAVKHGLEEVLDTTTAAIGIVEELRRAVVPFHVRSGQ